MIKNMLAIFSLAFPLNKARNRAPKERIAPGKLGSCVPPNAEPMIKMLKTISKFSMKLSFFFCLQNQTFEEHGKYPSSYFFFSLLVRVCKLFFDSSIS